VIHKISQVLDIQAGDGAGLDAVSKANAAYNLASVDLTKYEGGFEFYVDCGGISGGATVDFKLQDSDDNASFADVASAAITQITANGRASLESRVRAVRRYVRGVLTVGTASTVVGVKFIGQKRAI
jgi:hypothetical protein